MARNPRLEIAGGIHHVTSRGNRRQEVFQCGWDRRLFLAELERAVVRRQWICLAYCLLGNHYHLVLETPDPNLSAGMRDLLSRFVRQANDRVGVNGRMFGGRFHSVLVQNDAHFAHLLRYVALNPVNAGLCQEPSQWQWSSHAQMLAGAASPLVAIRRVEELLAPWGGAPGDRYARLLAEDGPFGPWASATEPLPPRPSIADLLAEMPRDEAMRTARHRHGYRIVEIARAAGLSKTTVGRLTRG